MGQVANKTVGMFVIAAGLSLAAPGAQATAFYNLTGAGADGVVIPNSFNYAEINGGIFTSGSNTDKVGTGVIAPFVRIQTPGNGSCSAPCIESGFNTDGTKQFETKDNGGSNWNRSLTLDDIGTETIDGKKYRVFILDINEDKTGPGRFLSLDKFQVYLGATGDIDTFYETRPDCPDPTVCSLPPGLQGGATNIFDIDGSFLAGDPEAPNNDATIGLDYSLNRGSGRGIDLVAYVPDDGRFNDATRPYVYLYSSFGATGILRSNNGPNPWDKNGVPPTSSPAGYLPAGDYGESAGFEEWSTKFSRTPEPLTAGLLLIGLAALGLSRRQRLSPSCA